MCHAGTVMASTSHMTSRRVARPCPLDSDRWAHLNADFFQCWSSTIPCCFKLGKPNVQSKTFLPCTQWISMISIRYPYDIHGSDSLTIPPLQLRISYPKPMLRAPAVWQSKAMALELTHDERREEPLFPTARLWTIFQEISNRTHWTDPSTWVSNSSSNLLRGPLVRSHSILIEIYKPRNWSSVCNMWGVKLWVMMTWFVSYPCFTCLWDRSCAIARNYFIPWWK